jgi:hypothetical protein
LWGYDTVNCLAKEPTYFPFLSIEWIESLRMNQLRPHSTTIPASLPCCKHPRTHSLFTQRQCW